ncbi:glycosyltransferase [Herbiconiux sp.]|uniref:glycosyltransferase n=1 Tax=Herbiconiux sp. TaxID=1871186 RepID=UPI0025B893CE|nr:glycosyltransferase [Herbiconiux sp.]
MSVVIPTIGRDHVFRAVESVLAQTEPVLEILVVADTIDEFALPDDRRIRVLRTGPFAGGNTARQAGIDAAVGDVIGLLDDDDEWLPDKIRAQLDLVGENAPDVWIATSRVLMRRSATEVLVQPARPVGADENLLHYMFHKASPRAGHGFIQASTLLFPRSLAAEVQFDRSLKFHQDISWLVDVVAAHPEVRVLQVWDALVTYHSTEGSVSKKIDPAGSIAWARRRLGSDRRTLGDFILTQSLGFARRNGSVGSMVRVIATALRYGRPSPSALVYAVAATAKAGLRGSRGRSSSTPAASPPHATRVVMSPGSSMDDDNPFVSLLVESLPSDIIVEEFRWKTALLGSYDVLHIHWPEHILKGGSRLRGVAKELAFLALIARNRLMARHVRTVHNLRPHEAGTRLNRFVLSAWERSCAVSVYLSDAGREAAAEDDRERRAVTIVHGDYRPFLERLAVDHVETVPGRLLAFGYLRPYKGFEQLITALKQSAPSSGLTLKIAGSPLPRSYATELQLLSEDDERIEVAAGRLGDRELLKEIQASMAVVLPYRQVYNSGAALLALTANRPIIVTASPTMQELALEVGESWVRLVDDWSAESLERAVADLPEPTSAPDLTRRSWETLGRRYADVYRAASSRRRK